MEDCEGNRGKWIAGCSVAAMLGAIAIIGGCSYTNTYTYSSGSRVGMINKISKKGFVYKTYEGQMALEGIVSNGSNTGANVWEFSLDGQAKHGEDTEELAKKLNDSLESGKKVKINYIEVWNAFPWRGDTNYFVQSVEQIK